LEKLAWTNGIDCASIENSQRFRTMRARAIKLALSCAAVAALSGMQAVAAENIGEAVAVID